MEKHDNDANALARQVLDAGLLAGTLSSPVKAEGYDGCDKLRLKPVLIKGEKAYQIEEFRGPKAFQRNVDGDSLVQELASWLGQRFKRAEFKTAAGTMQILANRRGQLKLFSQAAATAGAGGSALTQPVEFSHNRAKDYILKEGAPVPFLIDLGVMKADGSVIKAKYDKFKQINRFLEFIEDVLPELAAAAAEREDKTLELVDFGCGKSYLSFAVYHYLSTLKGLSLRVTGLDLKEDVIRSCQALAVRYGYKGLSFAVGDIADYSGVERADLVISLHACDTATDFALAKAVSWGARVILAVPCCQHELNAQLGGRGAAAAKAPARVALASAFKYGIVRERMAALLTDALRAELLESRGYRTQILEFIDMSHTPKNLLIRAVKRASGLSSEGSVEGYAALRDFLGAEPTLGRELPPQA
ncbi:MAG TPA: SAM-dependent methyltransferase [Spirochaetaceae bacterium]|nr:SAM-dependent methyltransferase [Spirochaetaceae bacterium]